MRQATMTAQQATMFQRYSVHNAATITSTLTCGCKPYQDVYTYNRWIAQGYQVMRGEHSIHLPVIVQRDMEVKNDDGTTKIEVRKFQSHAPVFCRHQVKAINTGIPAKQETSIMPVIVPPKIESTPVESTKVDNIMTGWRVI